MSAQNTACIPVTSEGANGAGEMSCTKTYGGNVLSPANIIASEIMNCIVDNAMDIVLEKDNELQKPPHKKISTNVVGDIIDNILSNPSEDARKNETILLDDDLKRIINEMKYPPEDKCPLTVTSKDVKSEMTIPTKNSLVENFKRNTLERKKRLSKLVRNPKQIISKFKSNDTKQQNDILDGDCEENMGNCRQTPYPCESVMDTVDLKKNTDSEIENTDGGQTEDLQDKPEGSSKKKWNIRRKLLKYLKKTPAKEKKQDIPSSD